MDAHEHAPGSAASDALEPSSGLPSHSVCLSVSSPSLSRVSPFHPFLAGLLCDLLWSDPDKDTSGWGENDRGVSFTFGSEVVGKFLHKHDMDLICRAHQVVEDGYEFFAKRQLVTLFSAPNYCGEFDNAGAMMSVDDTLMCSFQILKPAEKKNKYSYGGADGTRANTPPRGGARGSR